MTSTATTALKYALTGLSCLSFLLLHNIEANAKSTHLLKGPVAANVERVIDGDTVIVKARIWLDQDLTVVVRLAGIDAPDFDHPLWEFRPDTESNSATASSTWRCKECHGWDYKGRDGAYSKGSHFTDIKGIFNTTKNPQEIFDLLKADPIDFSNGHDMDTYGLSDVDLWDLVKFSLEGTIETDDYIDSNNSFIGNAPSGNFDYQDICFTCHGEDGKKFILGHNGDLEFVGTVAVNNPWEFIHNVRFGHPAASMPAGERLFWSLSKIANIGAHAQTLPVE